MNNKTKLLNCIITFHTKCMQESKSTTQVLYGLHNIRCHNMALHQPDGTYSTQAAGTDDYTGTRHKCHLGRRSLTGV